MPKSTDSTVQILGIPISGTEKHKVLRRLTLQRKELHHVSTVNPEFVIESLNNKKFKKALIDSDETVADGWGIVWASRILYGHSIPRISGHDLVDYILEKSNDKKSKVFLLGAAPGVAERAAHVMRSRYPKLDIAWYEGSVNVKRERRDEMGLTLAKINAFEPDYLLVAYGSPWQDMWIEENREYLRAKVAIGVGGVLDEWAGVVRPCPRVIDKAGLKWLWRLVMQPWRWRRQVKVWKFGFLVILTKIKKMLR